MHVKAGFHLWRSRSRNQKRRTLLSSENNILILLKTVVYDQVKTRLSESQAEVEELNQPQKHGNVLCDCRFILPLVLLSTPTFWFSLDHKQQSHKLAETVENGNTLILLTLIPSCLWLCLQLWFNFYSHWFFIFHLTSPTLTSSLVKNQP